MSDARHFADSLEEAERLLDMVCASNSPMAIDCEGKNLGRDGTLGLMQIAIPGCALVIDVQTIGGQVLNDPGSELRKMLEDEKRVKVFFDCRRDCDALLRHFGLQVRNIRDLQIQDVLLRDLDDELEQHRLLRSFIHHGSLRGQPHLYKHVVKLKGLQQVLKEHDLEDLAAAKGARVDHDEWCKRPLTATQKDYAFGDVIGICKLFEKMRGDHDYDDAEVRAISERYADSMRELARLPDSLYLDHPLLPLCVVPDVPPVSRTDVLLPCPKCHQRVPAKMVSRKAPKKQLPKQRCDVCRAIDVQQSVLANFARSTFDRDDSDGSEFYHRYDGDSSDVSWNSD